MRDKKADIKEEEGKQIRERKKFDMERRQKKMWKIEVEERKERRKNWGENKNNKREEELQKSTKMHYEVDEGK